MGLATCRLGVAVRVRNTTRTVLRLLRVARRPLGLQGLRTLFELTRQVERRPHHRHRPDEGVEGADHQGPDQARLEPAQPEELDDRVEAAEQSDVRCPLLGRLLETPAHVVRHGPANGLVAERPTVRRKTTLLLGELPVGPDDGRDPPHPQERRCDQPAGDDLEVGEEREVLTRPPVEHAQYDQPEGNREAQRADLLLASPDPVDDARVGAIFSMKVVVVQRVLVESDVDRLDQLVDRAVAADQECDSHNAHVDRSGYAPSGVHALSEEVTRESNEPQPDVLDQSKNPVHVSIFQNSRLLVPCLTIAYYTYYFNKVQLYFIGYARGNRVMTRIV